MVLKYVFPGLLTQQTVKAILVINSMFYHNKFGVLSLKHNIISVFLFLFCYKKINSFKAKNDIAWKQANKGMKSNSKLKWIM